MIYIILNSKKLLVNKIIFYILLILISIITFTNIFLIKNFNEGLSGLFLYINMLLYYICFTIFYKKNTSKEKVHLYISSTITSLCILFFFTQRLFYSIRIYGNIGYANSYALLLLFAIYINRLRKNDIFSMPYEIILITGILFTGSRTTLILLFIYILISSYKLKSLNSFEALFWATMQYSIYSKLGLLSLLIIPIIIGIYYFVQNFKFKNLIVYLGIVFVTLLIIFDSSNTFKRIRNFSILNGSLQERFIYFEDSFNSIINNPIGHGISTFQYNQSLDASAYYDVKYIHNSILQIAYESGIISSLFFILVIVFFAIYILKYCNTNKLLWLCLYMSIFFHSLLDFDFSYSTFLIMLVFIVVTSTSYNRENTLLISSKTIPIAIMFILTPCLYLTFFETTILIGKNLRINNNHSSAILVDSFANSISFNNDTRQLYNSSLSLKALYDDSVEEPNYDNLSTDSMNYLNNMENTLLQAISINPNDMKLLWNLNYIYVKKKDFKLIDKIYPKLCTAFKYNPNFYTTELINYEKIYKNNNEDIYNDKVKFLNELYNKSLEVLNPRAKFIKNQLTP